METKVTWKTDNELRRLLVFHECSCLVLSAPGIASPDAKTVLMLGGRGSTATENNITDDAAAPFRRELLRRGYIVLCPDCGPDNWGSPQASRMVLQVLECLSAEGVPHTARPLPVMGFSMGAVGALMFAVRHPERVSRIISVFGAFDLADLRTRSEKLQSSIDSVYPT
ncbi:MAG: hypothetical protein J6Y80_02350, partial [Victivallales bacterium]|nr:hypothetical protein [Victivallales bacterium]